MNVPLKIISTSEVSGEALLSTQMREEPLGGSLPLPKSPLPAVGPSDLDPRSPNLASRSMPQTQVTGHKK